MHLKEDRASFSEVITSRSTPNERFLSMVIAELIMPEAARSLTHQKCACRNQRITLLERQRAHRTLHQCIKGTRW